MPERRADRHDDQQMQKRLTVESISHESGRARASVPGTPGHHEPGQRAQVVDAVLTDPRIDARSTRRLDVRGRVAISVASVIHRQLSDDDLLAIDAGGGRPTTCPSDRST
jgi:hypothetical protein